MPGATLSRWTMSYFAIACLMLLTAAPLMGLAIAGMHYTGMAAMRVPARIHYHAGLVVLSVVIAIVSGCRPGRTGRACCAKAASKRNSIRASNPGRIVAIYPARTSGPGSNTTWRPSTPPRPKLARKARK